MCVTAAAARNSAPRNSAPRNSAPRNSAQFFETPSPLQVYIAETDHLMLRPMPNLATPTTPAGFNFGYMVAAGQANIVNKFVPGLGGKTDPVGPSPVIIHVDQLKKVAR